MEGEEVVYDFVNLRRAWFHFEGEGASSNVLDISTAIYAGFVWGFRSATANPPGGVDIQYPGRAVGMSVGAVATHPEIGAAYVGTGGVLFSSASGEWPGEPNWDVWGIAHYYSAGAGTGFYDNPWGGAVYTSQYDQLGRIQQYESFQEMRADIMSGSGSPITKYYTHVLDPAVTLHRALALQLGPLWSVLP